MNNSNQTRLATADLAKGIAILLMIQVHLTEIFAEPSFYEGLLGKISLFLGGPFVAPVFMAVLGYFSAKSKLSFFPQLWRGVRLLILALLLNVGLNFNLLLKIYNGTIKLSPLEYILGVDILFLAGLSIILLAIFRIFFKQKTIWYLLTGVLVTIVTPMLTESMTVSSNSQYLFAYVAGDYRWSYFPLFPWLAYPLLGYALCLFHKEYESFFSKPLWKRIVLPLAGLGLVITTGFSANTAIKLESFYHHGILFFAWTVLFLLFWFSMLSLLEADLGNTAIFIFVKWLGRRVTTIYVLQWLIIGNLGTLLYKTQNLSQLIIWYLLILLTVSFSAYYFDKLKLQR